MLTIDHQLAQSILNKLDYSLQDLSLDFGDVVIPDGDISHVLSGSGKFFNIYIENGIYFTSGNSNYSTPEEAAIECIDCLMVAECIDLILAERESMKDYF